MPHDTPLIATIVIGLCLAFVLGAIAQRIRVSPLVGYLLAGVALGPYTPGFVADQSLAAELAEIGVILLMFGVGLHFSLKDLWSVRAVAIPGAIVQIAVASLFGLGLGLLLGWPVAGGIVFGLALSVASTVVLLRALQERRLVNSERGRIAIGWLIVEDIVMVLTLVLLPGLAPLLLGTEPGQAAAFDLTDRCGDDGGHGGQDRRVRRDHADRRPPRDPLGAALRRPHRLARAVPPRRAGDRARRRLWRGEAVRRLLRARRLFRRHDPERIRAEPAGRLRDAAAARRLRGPVLHLGRHAVRPAILLRDPLPVLATVAIIVLGKSVAALAIMLAFRHPLSTALTISASLAQIGEFSFILAGLGVALEACCPSSARS